MKNLTQLANDFARGIKGKIRVGAAIIPLSLPISFGSCQKPEPPYPTYHYLEEVITVQGVPNETCWQSGDLPDDKKIAEIYFSFPGYTFTNEPGFVQTSRTPTRQKNENSEKLLELVDLVEKTYIKGDEKNPLSIEGYQTLDKDGNPLIIRGRRIIKIKNVEFPDGKEYRFNHSN